MQRVLLAIIVLLAALLLAREPRIEKADHFFLSWLLHNTMPKAPPVPLLVVELSGASLAASDNVALPPGATREVGSAVSPLEFALFFQALLDWKPTVIAIEPLLRWREQDKDQEQIFLDQAMRVPKLLLAAELTSTPDPDLPPQDLPGFPHVQGRRGDLPVFAGISRQPNEDLRLISTLAFINRESADDIHVPLLFQYRGEVIPSFAFAAFLQWARIPLSEVQIELGSRIVMPRGWRIPIAADGSILVNPNAIKLARRIDLNELLLLAQQPANNPVLAQVPNELVLARTPRNPLAPPELFAAAIATLQSNHYVRRVSIFFDCVILLLIAFLTWLGIQARRVDVILGLLGFTAAYCLAGLTLLARYEIWLPGVVPLVTSWVLGALALAWPRKKQPADAAEVIPSSPVP